MTKIPHITKYSILSQSIPTYTTPIELTGRQKIVTGGGRLYEVKFFEVQERWFGIPIYKRWVIEDDISFYEPEKVEYINQKG